MDRRRRESEGKAKIEGYMSVSDEEAHHRGSVLRDVGYTVLCAMPHVRLQLRRWYGWNGTG